MTFATDRPEEIPDEAVAALERDYPQVGYETGQPLLAESYEEYPDEVLLPDTREILAQAADTLATLEDIGDELGVATETVRKAFHLHGLDRPNGGASFDLPNADEVDLPLGPTVDTDHLRDLPHRDARLLQHLYVTCRYDAEEIATFLEGELNGGRGPSEPRIRVPEQEVRSELADIGLVEAEEATDSEFKGPNAKGRLGGASVEFTDDPSPGNSTDIDLGAVERSDNVTVR